MGKSRVLCWDHKNNWKCPLGSRHGQTLFPFIFTSLWSFFSSFLSFVFKVYRIGHFFLVVHSILLSLPHFSRCPAGETDFHFESSLLRAMLITLLFIYFKIWIKVSQILVVIFASDSKKDWLNFYISWDTETSKWIIGQLPMSLTFN